MSKAAWAGLLLTGGGLGLVAFLLTAGLPSDAQLVAKTAKASAERSQTLVDETIKEFSGVVQTEEQLLSALPEVTQGGQLLKTRKSALEQKRATLESDLDALLTKNSHNDAYKVQKLAAELTIASNQAINGIRVPVATAQKFLGYKTKFNDILTTARDDLQMAKAFAEDAAFSTQVDSAATAYPEAREAIQKRSGAARSQAGALLQHGAQLAARAGIDPPDYIGVGRTAETISKGATALRKMSADLRRDIGQLPTGIDKILIDMKTESGRYYHKYRIIENGASRETGWEDVTKSVYQRHREHLGMTIYSKPEGVLEAEALKSAVPPGYNYVGNTRYGRWEDRGGTSFWVFYGRYALMRHLLWGRGHYRPVRRSAYQSYRTQRRLGRAWYGVNKEYGTKGKRTRVRYASSAHYKQRRRYSSSSSRSSGSRSGGSRSGGSRRGRYSGSSFGGFGK